MKIDEYLKQIMEQQHFYCNNYWFKTYDEAKMYADKVLEMDNKYYVVFTKAEKDATINHKEECGK
jgi:hypothetical protein